MEAKHTPGPWYADKIEDRAAYNIFPHGATYALLQVAGPFHDGAHPYGIAAEANARLIAAAPTTASMAMDFTMLVESFLRPEVAPRNVTESELAEAMYALRAHIAKATGAA